MFGTFNIRPKICLLQSWNCFIPWRDCTKAEPKLGPLNSISILFCLRNGFDILKIRTFRRHFKSWKKKFSPKGLWKQKRRWSNCCYFPFYCVWEMVLTFSKSEFSEGIYEILKMFYNLKWLCFLCKAEPKGVHFDFFHFIVKASLNTRKYVNSCRYFCSTRFTIEKVWFLKQHGTKLFGFLKWIFF